jgi:hypothetical protein
MKLDNRFFQLITVKHHGGVEYEAYKSVYVRSTMVLFSRKTKTPLAALTFKAEDVGCLSMLTGRPSPRNDPRPYFQGILNMPDQAIDFTITNLSNEGMINFNILHTPHEVKQVDPGPNYGVNQLNELIPNQSYTIKADQRTGCKMIVAGKTKLKQMTKESESTKVALTIRESEAERHISGLYFYLSVVPDKACQDLVLKFREGTVWKASSGFIRRVKSQQNPNGNWHFRRLHQGPVFQGLAVHRLRGSTTISDRDLSETRVPDLPPFVVKTSDACRGAQRGHEGQCTNQDVDIPRFEHVASVNNREVVYPQTSTSAAWPRFAAMYGAQYSSIQASTGNSEFGYPQILTSAAMPRFEEINGTQYSSFQTLTGSTELHRDPEGQIPGESTRDTSLESARLVSQGHHLANTPKTQETVRFVESFDVGTTQATELRYGKRENVYTYFTGRDYAYNWCSEPTVLCLSIWKDMRFLPLSNIEKEIIDEMDEWVRHEEKKLIESLNAVYKSNVCVIDLESEADTIICPCGHQCINHTNAKDLRNCPLCRSSISGFVRANGLLQ